MLGLIKDCFQICEYINVERQGAQLHIHDVLLESYVQSQNPNITPQQRPSPKAVCISWDGLSTPPKETLDTNANQAEHVSKCLEPSTQETEAGSFRG